MNPSRVHTRRLVGAVIMSTAVAVGVSACGNDNDSAGQPSDPIQSAIAKSEADRSGPNTDYVGPASGPTGSGPSTGGSGGYGGDQIATALTVVDVAQKAVPEGKVFDLEDKTRADQRVWEAKVADAQDRRFNVVISADGSQVLSNEEDKTSDDIGKLREATVELPDAIRSAAGRASGGGAVSGIEIDTDDGGAQGGRRVVWQVDFGEGEPLTALVDAKSGEVLKVGPDVD